MITIDTWSGLVTNASPYALPPGAAATQVNFQCLRPGELSVRNGQATVAVSTHASTESVPVVIVRHPIGADEAVVYQNSSGALILARGIQ